MNTYRSTWSPGECCLATYNIYIYISSLFCWWVLNKFPNPAAISGGIMYAKWHDSDKSLAGCPAGLEEYKIILYLYINAVDAVWGPYFYSVSIEEFMRMDKCICVEASSRSLRSKTVSLNNDQVVYVVYVAETMGT